MQRLDWALGWILGLMTLTALCAEEEGEVKAFSQESVHMGHGDKQQYKQ